MPPEETIAATKAPEATAAKSPPASDEQAARPWNPFKRAPKPPAKKSVVETFKTYQHVAVVGQTNPMLNPCAGEARNKLKARAVPNQTAHAHTSC